MNSKIFIVIFLILTFLSNGNAQELKKLKVGFIAPFTGDAASYGIASKNGFLLALSEESHPLIEPIFEDDQYIATKTVSAFKKLTEIDKVDILISMASTPSNAIASLAESRHVPLFAWANDQKIMQDRSYVMLTEQGADVQGDFIAQEAIKRSYKSIAYISSVGDYQNAISESVKEKLKDKIIFSDEVTTETNDFRTLALKIKSLKPEAIGMCFHPSQAGMFARQAQELGFVPAFFGCGTMLDKSELELSRGALKDAWFASLNIAHDFTEKYFNHYGDKNILTGAAVHYELSKLLSELMRERTSKENLFSAMIAKGKRSGAIGSYRVVHERGGHFFKIDMIPAGYEKQ